MALCLCFTFYVWIVATLSYVKLSFLSIWVSCKSVVIQLSVYHYLALTLCLRPWISQSCVCWDVISNRNEVSHHTKLNWHWWGDLFELYLQDKGNCCRLVKYIGRLELGKIILQVLSATTKGDVEVTQNSTKILSPGKSRESQFDLFLLDHEKRFSYCTVWNKSLWSMFMSKEYLCDIPRYSWSFRFIYFLTCIDKHMGMILEAPSHLNCHPTSSWIDVGQILYGKKNSPFPPACSPG